MMGDENETYVEKQINEINTPNTKRDRFILNGVLVSIIIPLLFIFGFGIFYFFGVIYLILNLIFTTWLVVPFIFIVCLLIKAGYEDYKLL